MAKDAILEAIKGKTITPRRRAYRMAGQIFDHREDAEAARNTMPAKQRRWHPIEQVEVYPNGSVV